MASVVFVCHYLFIITVLSDVCPCTWQELGKKVYYNIPSFCILYLLGIYCIKIEKKSFFFKLLHNKPVDIVEGGGVSLYKLPPPLQKKGHI